jgi:hypothetical protein
MAEEKKHNPKTWKPGGEKGKLHGELGVPADQKIPAAKLAAATHSENPEIRRDAIRAETMEGWHHGGAGEAAKKKRPASRTARPPKS